MTPEPRPEIEYLTPAVHGSVDVAELRRLGLRREDVLDFSANINPYGPSPRVRDALARAAIDRYPDRGSLDLRRALAEIHGAITDRILVGNGSSELIQLIALAFARGRDSVMVLGPTYSEYMRACQAMGTEVATWQARAEDGFGIDAPAVAWMIDMARPRVVFLCNPNNPTGVCVPPATIAAWARRHPSTLFVVDEAYQAFAEAFQSALSLGMANVLVLRSLTKDYALAGLRLGYALAAEEVIRRLASVQTPWSVNAVAQAAGLAALADQTHLQETLSQLRRDTEQLMRQLKEQGRTVLASAVHFFLLHVGNAAACREALLRQGILVRDASSFGLPAYVRIATRRPADNERLVSALAELRDH